MVPTNNINNNNRFTNIAKQLTYANFFFIAIKCYKIYYTIKIL
jgi:hypothetical protein